MVAALASPPTPRAFAARPASRLQTSARTGARVYRRRRAVALIALAAAAVLMAMAIRMALAGPGGGALTTAGPSGVRPRGAQVYVVQPGDTLWSIVRAAGVKGDPRPVVDRLAAQLGGHDLQIGQRLAWPS